MAAIAQEGGVPVLPVSVGSLRDSVALVPFDPRAPELSALAPEAAEGLYTGTLAQAGAPLHLVWRPEGALGVLALDSGPVWVTIQDGVLVAYVQGPSPWGPQDHPLDAEVHAPADVVAAPLLGGGDRPVLSAGADGVLQIMLDGDEEYHNHLGDLWDDYQLAIFTLIDGIYQANFGVRIEVVTQHVWTTPDPFDGDVACDDSASDRLRQFRDYWEGVDPTTSDEREVAHLFSRRAPGPSLWGCAYIGQLETSFAYAVSWLPFLGLRSEDPPVNTGPLAPYLHGQVTLVAHELGHNFAGLHSRAVPAPGGLLDLLCPGPATIMYPFVDCGNALVFSDANGADPDLLELLGAMNDGGNAPHMKTYFTGRI